MTDKALFDACDTFARVANIIDALPDRVGPDVSLRAVLPGAWPTVGDARRLRDAMVTLGWTRDYIAPQA